MNMKHIIVVAGALSLVGCASTREPQIKTVNVSIPVPFCPAPPTIPACANYVDALTPDDAKDPGKVAQAYKLDMACYRSNDASFRKIVSLYGETSVMADKVKEMLDQVGQEYNNAIQPGSTNINHK